MDDKAVIEREQVVTRKERARRIAEIRLMAFAALHGEGQGFEPWRYFGELKALEKRPMSIAFLEAQIATCVVGRIRPAKIVRAMQKLRKRRREQGEEDKFHQFEALLKSNLDTGTLSNHGYYRATFATLDHDEMWGQVGAHVKALNDAGYQVFLNSGTLLGVVRDGRFIEHDDDIDLALVLNASSAAEAAAEWNGLKDKLGVIGVFDTDGDTVRGIHKLKSPNGCEIDLFPAWIEDDQVFVYPHTSGELGSADVLPLKPCPVSGEPMPADPEKMLAQNYGPNWREPDPYFKFPWPQARKKFKDFLEAVE
ncbi:LicD family protein [Primorskyibacter sp. S87]|uniref:LicD family protein n=1 Tax=Primorskyibacter sp. S87 TaxID=3415126 RepID=UPI003C7DE882